MQFIFIYIQDLKKEDAWFIDSYFKCEHIPDYSIYF